MFRRIIAVSLVFCFLIQQAGFTQLNNSFAIPDYLAGLLLPERFRPLNLQLLTFDKITNEVTAGFDLGDLIGKDSKEIESQIEQVKDYFMTALVLPNSTFWVNLRPDSPYQIMDEDMAKTQLGKVLVEADLQLKKDLAQLTSPQHSLGRRFWSEIYGKINTLFNPEEDIEIPTMTRPWIVPGEIILGQSDNRVYIYKATLKVCLEEDWLEWSNKHKQVPISDTTILLDKNDNRIKELNRYASELVHQLILPQLTRQVNQSRKYASLRQVYHCLILANWVKEYVKANNLSKKSKIFSKIDSRDLTSFTLPKQWSLETYFNEYRKSFFQGEYNLQEEVEGKFGIELRQYISGGFDARDGGLSQATTSFFTRIGDFVIRLGNLVIKKLTEASFDIEEKKDMEYYLKLIEELKDETIFSKHPEPLLLAMLVFDHDGEIDKVKCFSGSTTEGKLRRGEFGVTADGKLVLVKEGWDISNLPSDEIRERQLPDVVLLEEGKDYVLVKKTFPEGEIWLFLNKKRLKGELFSSKYDGGQLAQIEKLYLWYQRNNLQRPTEEQNKINQLFASALAYLDQKTSLPALTRTDNPFFVLKQSLEVLVENKERYKQLFNEKEVNIEELLIYETIDTLAQSIFNQVVFRIKETDNTFSEEQVDSLKEIVKKLNNLDPLLAEKILQITEDLKSRNRPFEKENNSNLKVAEIKNEVERIEEGKLTASAIRKELERLRKQIEGVRGNTTGKEIEIKKLLEEIEEKLVFYGAYPIDEIKAIIPEEFLSFAENNFKPERFLKVIWGKLEDSGYGYEKLGKEEKDRLEKEVRKKLEKTIEQFNKFGLTLFYPEITEIYELSGELGEFIRYVYLYIDIKNKEQKRNSQQGQTKDGGTSTTSGQASLIFDILSSSATERKELWNIKGVLKTLTQMIQNKERIDEEYPIDSWINMLEILWLSTPEYSPEIKDVLLAIANSEMYSPQTQQKALFATRNDQKLDGGAVFSDLFSNILERIKENHAIVNRWGKLLEVNSSAELIDSVNKEFEVYNQMKNALEELQKLILKETKNDKQFQESLQGKIVVALNVLEVALRQQISLAEQLILKYDISPEKTAELRNVLLKSEENILPILNDALNSIIKQLSRYIEEQQNNQLETNKDGREEVGGIDFRILPFLHNQINKPTNIIVPEHLMNLELHQMQNYWQSLEKKAYTETFPYQQIKEFVVACNNRNDCKELLVTVSAFLVHILKLEEEAAVPTAKELKEILCCIG